MDGVCFRSNPVRGRAQPACMGDAKNQNSFLGSALSFGIIIGIGFTALSIRKLIKGSRLSIELRRRGPRYFLIGLLIGCGVACLLEGLCFAGMGVAMQS